MDEQRRLILDQFTRQAVPFSQMHARDDAEIHQLLIRTAGITGTDEVLDVACGPGLVACEVAKVARHATGIDLTPAMIEQARARQLSLGLANLTWVVGDALPLPFPDAIFSRAVTRYSFHHFTDTAGVFAEMVRVCKPGAESPSPTCSPIPRGRPRRMTVWRNTATRRTPTRCCSLNSSRCSPGFLTFAGSSTNTPSRSRNSSRGRSPGGADAFRRTVEADVGVNQIGIDASRDGGLRFAFPVVVMSGVK